MKRITACFLTILLCCCAAAVSVCAADASRQYRFELSADGGTEVHVLPGETVTVTLRLVRTDSDASYPMYAMQDEIRYDSDFFVLAEGGTLLSPGIAANDIARRDNHREFYMNYLSVNGGTAWPADMTVGSFQLRVTAEAGVSRITQEDYLVSLPNGSGSYVCTANALTVVVSTDCLIRFDTNGGAAMEPITGQYGEKIPRPADPVRSGKYFTGWYRDIDLTELWDFDTDTVDGNLVLFAGWSDTPVPAPGEKTGWGWMAVLALAAAAAGWLIFAVGRRTKVLLCLADTPANDEFRELLTGKKRLALQDLPYGDRSRIAEIAAEKGIKMVILSAEGDGSGACEIAAQLREKSGETLLGVIAETEAAKAALTGLAAASAVADASDSAECKADKLLRSL